MDKSSEEKCPKCGIGSLEYLEASGHGYWAKGYGCNFINCGYFIPTRKIYLKDLKPTLAGKIICRVFGHLMKTFTPMWGYHSYISACIRCGHRIKGEVRYI